MPTSGHVRLVKGSHIVVRRLFEHDHAYIFQNADNRIIFAIPYERDFTLIGTTDQEFKGDLERPDRQRRRDRLSVPRRQRVFPRAVTPDQVVHPYRACASSMTTGRAARKTSPANTCSTSKGAPARRRC